MKNCFFFLIFTFIGVAAMAQWESDPAVNNQITPTNFTIFDNLIVTAGKQCTYIAFNRPTSSAASIGYYLQILDEEGVKVFDDPGLLVSDETSLSFTMVNNFLFVDSEGNAIIGASDLRNGGEGSNDMRFTLYKVSPAGAMLWGDDGIPLSTGANYGGTNLNMVQLTNGNLVFAWARNSNGSIGMQCVSPAGQLLWTEQTQMDDNKPCMYPYLVPSDDGCFILLYSERNVYGNPIARYSWLKAKKFDADCQLVWGPVTIYTDGYTIPALQSVFDVVSDKNGGMMVGWYDAHVVSNREDAYVAHLKTDGTLGFTDNAPVRVGNHAIYRSFRPKISVSPARDFFVTWEENNANQSYQRTMVQKYSIQGVEAWVAGGIQIADNTGGTNEGIGYESIQATDDGQVAHFYMKQLSPYSTTNSYISLLDADGNYVWEEEHINFTTTPCYRTGLQSTPFVGGEYWLTLWQDGRGGGLENIPLYLQRINIDGSLGTYTPVVVDECLPPSNINVELQPLNNAFSAQISWTAESDSYNFAYKKEADAEWENSSLLSDPQIILNGLDVETTYQYQIQSICEDTTSVWISGSFTTVVDNIYEYSSNPTINVSAENQKLHISNKSQALIEKVYVYQLNGVLIQEYVVKSSGDLTLPLPLKTSIVMVTLQGKTFNNVYKVFIP
ncbi:MAG: fibronectin type III domain-containing protein [Bacteroidales bacterium]|jgi:hypothetical protein|nr:fibronectin type III domain-containing protein [Bacteroidales bacterium]